MKPPPPAGAALIFLCLTAARVEALPLEPGWYKVDLEKGSRFTARLLGEEKGFYLLSYEGAVLRVAKSGVQRLERVDVETEGPASGEAPPPAEAPSAPQPDRRLEPSILDAIEGLASQDDEAVDRSYDLIAKELSTARPMVHLALSHRSPRVRALCTKVLGEAGSAKEDLAAAAARLTDKRPEVRLSAVMAVRALGSEALPRLIDYLSIETVPNNRKMAVKTLEVWEDGRAVAPLAGLLFREEDEGVRDFIACALEALTGQRLGRDAEAWAAYLEGEKRVRELEEVSRAALGGRRAPPIPGAPEAEETPAPGEK